MVMIFTAAVRMCLGGVQGNFYHKKQRQHSVTLNVYISTFPPTEISEYPLSLFPPYT